MFNALAAVVSLSEAILSSNTFLEKMPRRDGEYPVRV